MKLQRIDDGKMTSKYDTALNLYNTRLKDEDAEKAVKAILEKVSENNTNDVKRFLFSTIEITSLTVTDNEDSILALTEKINDFTEENPTFPHPAAICVYPRFAKIVSESLEADGVEKSPVWQAVSLPHRHFQKSRP